MLVALNLYRHIVAQQIVTGCDPASPRGNGGGAMPHNRKSLDHTVAKDFFPLPDWCHPLFEERQNSVLLQSSRCDPENFRSYLFLDSVETLSVHAADALPALFQRLSELQDSGHFVAGFLSYECAAHFEPAVNDLDISAEVPLAWFGAYRNPAVFDHRSGLWEGAAPSKVRTNAALSYSVGDPQLRIDEKRYLHKIGLIQECIRRGDTYQVNLTDRVQFQFSGSVSSFFRDLTLKQAVPYAAFIHMENREFILSCSPELFFKLRDGRVLARPMKGTAPRGKNSSEDEEICRWLQNDPKNRAENIMIVDLLRNDLGRLCKFGTVHVDELFAVERYRTLFQMTSTVSGELQPATSMYDVLKSVFPCGSITGAPKIRSMQIINELESGPRGIYTGAIGFMAPNSDATFSVAIRTVVLNSDSGEMGVGGGITIDSVAQDEYRECLLKSEFLMGDTPHFDLIETLLWEGGYPFIDFHLERIEDSARYFGFRFNSDQCRAVLDQSAHSFESGTRYKVRLSMSGIGDFSITHSKLGNSTESGRVTISPNRTHSQDKFLYHKTTCRQQYDSELAAAQREGFDEVLFLNERDEVTEGAISNIFARINGRLLTPPVRCGLLPGVFRRHVLATEANAAEQELTLQDLLGADEVYLCNAVRGMRRVELVLQATGRGL